MHCCIVRPGMLRFSKLILISHKPALRDGSSAANAGMTPRKPRSETVPTSRIAFLLGQMICGVTAAGYPSLVREGFRIEGGQIMAQVAGRNTLCRRLGKTLAP